MATSGSNTTWSSNGGHYVKVTWNETSQSTAENRSAVTVRLYVGSKSGWTISDSSNSYSLTINGTTYSGSNASISQTGSEDLILTKDVMINHDSDGTKSFSMKGAISGLYFGSISGTTFSGTLDTIARKSTMSSSANMTAGWNKTVSISRASSSFNHIVQVYVTRGATEKLIRTESFGTSETSKTLEWSNTQITEMFNSGHGYWTGTKFVVTTRSGTTSIGTNTYTGSLDWPSNNSVATMENSIDIGESFNVSISKASSLYAHEAKLTLTNGTALGTGSAQGITTGTSFSLKPVESIIESNTMTSQSISVQLWIRTVLASTTSTEVRDWTLEKTSTVYIPESPPTMGSMSYTELNGSVATAINSSGVNPPLVQGYSHPKFTFTAASPKRSASISNYSVSIGGETLSRTSAGSLDFTPANLGGRTIKVGSNTNAVLTVTDSRGFTNSISIPVRYMAYSPPALTINLRRLNGFGDTVELTGSATISSLGGINTVVAANGFKHKFRELPSGTFQATPIDLPSTIINGIPTITKKTTTLLNTKSFEFEVTVTDKITTTTVKKTIGTGKPIVFMDSKLLSVGINKFPSAANSLEVEGSTSLTGTLSVSGVATVGQLSTGRINVVGTNLEVANSFAEILKLTANSGTYGYMSLYNGTARLGYLGSISNNSTSIRLVSDSGWLDLLGQSGVNIYVAGTSRLHLNSSTTTVGNNLVVSGSIDGGTSSVEGALVHRSGYMYFKPYDTTTSHSGGYQHGQLYYSGASSTNEFVFSSRNTSGTLTNVDVRANNFVGKLNGTSSIRYKQNVEDYKEDALGKIKSSRVRTYSYKTDDSTERHLGIVIEENAPGEIISRKGESIDIYGMTSMTWKAVQQMDTKTDYLSMSMEWMEEQIILLKKEKTVMKSRMTKLEKKNKELEERLSRLEKLLGGD